MYTDVNYRACKKYYEKHKEDINQYSIEYLRQNRDRFNANRRRRRLIDRRQSLKDRLLIAIQENRYEDAMKILRKLEDIEQRLLEFEGWEDLRHYNHYNRK